MLARSRNGLAGHASQEPLLGERKSEAPYFSEDIALLGSLADVLSSVVWTNYYKKRFNDGAQKTSESDEPLRRTA